MGSLALKLLLTPALIGAASLAGRRWGPAISGWLVGLPFTSGPVVFFVALNQGTAFAAGAAAGTLAGTTSQAAFCLAYGRLAHRDGWPLSFIAGTLAFAALTIGLQRLTLPLPLVTLLVVGGLLLALWLMPNYPAPAAVTRPPGWDIPLRMAVVTAFVLLLTGVAPSLGPRLTGLVTPFPLYGSAMAVFAHRLEGPAAGAGVLRGLLLGLFGFSGFFLALAALLQRVGVAAAFLVALAVVLGLQATSLVVLRKLPRTQRQAAI